MVSLPAEEDMASPATTIPPAESGTGSRLFLDLAALVLLGAVIWGNTATFKFVWDDFPFIVNNQSIRSVSKLPAFFTDKATMATDPQRKDIPLFRPLRNVSFLIDYSLAGLKPAWWHVHNLLLHLINAILLLFIARSLLAGRFSALVAAGIFLLHPIQSEPVAWVKCRDDLLSNLFALAFLLLWVKWIRANARVGAWKDFCLASVYMLACLAKEQAVILPLLAFALDAIVPREKPDRSERGMRGLAAWMRRFPGSAHPRTYALLGLTGIAFLAWRTAVLKGVAQSAYPGGSAYHTLLTMPGAIASYFRLLAFPLHQSADYSGMRTITSWHDTRFLACSALILLLLASAIAVRKRFPLETFGAAWIAISLLPVLNIIPMMQFMAERFLYLPMVGFSLACGSLIARLEKNKRSLASALSMLLILGAGALTLNRIPIWRNEKAFFEATAEDSEYKAVRPYFNFISALLNNREFAKALPHARRLWRENADSPVLSLAQKADIAHMLGGAYLSTGRSDSGIAMLRQAVGILPGSSEHLQHLGIAYGNLRAYDSALAVFRRGALAFPAEPRFAFNSGLVLLEMRREAEAERAFLECQSQDPSFLPARDALSKLRRPPSDSLRR
jgi:protein O-mannosyl-transferase